MDPVKVGRAIKALRTKVGYTQYELANAIQVTDKAVSRWERGIGVPDISIINRVADLLNVVIDNLLEGNIAFLENDWKGLLLIDRMNMQIPLNAYLFDKPILHVWICYFILAGIREITIKAPDYLEAIIRSELQICELLGIAIHIVHSVDLIPQSNYMVIGDSIFLYGINLTKAFQRAMSYNNIISELAIPKRVGVETMRLDISSKDLTSDANATVQTYYRIPVTFIPCKWFELIKQDRIPVMQSEQNNHRIQPIGKGMIECIIHSFDDVAEISQFMKFMQNSTGLNIYCIEEIAWRRGLVSSSDLLSIVDRKTDKGEYLYSVIHSSV